MKILTPFKAVSLLLAPIIPTSFSEPKDNDSNENSPRFDKGTYVIFFLLQTLCRSYYQVFPLLVLCKKSKLEDDTLL